MPLDPIVPYIIKVIQTISLNKLIFIFLIYKVYFKINNLNSFTLFIIWVLRPAHPGLATLCFRQDACTVKPPLSASIKVSLPRCTTVFFNSFPIPPTLPRSVLRYRHAPSTPTYPHGMTALSAPRSTEIKFEFYFRVA